MPPDEVTVDKNHTAPPPDVATSRVRSAPDRIERHERERVQELKNRVRSGVYRLDESGIAEAFIRRMTDPSEDETPDYSPSAS